MPYRTKPAHAKYPPPVIDFAQLRVDVLMYYVLRDPLTRTGATHAQGHEPTNILDLWEHIVLGGHVESCIQYWHDQNLLVPVEVTHQEYVFRQVGFIYYRAEPLLRRLLVSLYRCRLTERVKRIDRLYRREVDFRESRSETPAVNDEMLIAAQEASLCSERLLAAPITDDRALALVQLFWHAGAFAQLYEAAHRKV